MAKMTTAPNPPWSYIYYQYCYVWSCTALYIATLSCSVAKHEKSVARAAVSNTARGGDAYLGGGGAEVGLKQLQVVPQLEDVQAAHEAEEAGHEEVRRVHVYPRRPNHQVPKYAIP